MRKHDFESGERTLSIHQFSRSAFLHDALCVAEKHSARVEWHCVFDLSCFSSTLLLLDDVELCGRYSSQGKAVSLKHNWLIGGRLWQSGFVWAGPALVCTPRRAATDGVLAIRPTKGSVGDQ